MIYIYIDLLLFKIKVNFLVFSIFIDFNKFFENDVREGLLGEIFIKLRKMNKKVYLMMNFRI